MFTSVSRIILNKCEYLNTIWLNKQRQTHGWRADYQLSWGKVEDGGMEQKQKRTRGYGQQGGDCGAEEGGIRGINGNGKR